MIKKGQYERNLQKLLSDNSICMSNRNLFQKFFEELEYKLKRQNGLKELTERQYKTLCGYIPYFKNVNLWFKNKEWKKLTEEDIKKVYDKLEDEKLKGCSGNIIKSKSDYYDKVFKSLPFELAGKKEIAQRVMRYVKNGETEVRFFEEETFKEIVNATKTIHQRLLCYLCWDIGENIFTILQLQKKDCIKHINPDTKENEYLINLPKEKIKKARTSRTEPTNYTESAELLDIIFKDLNDEDLLFNFGHRQAQKFLDKIVKKINAKCLPKGGKVTWKDFRSSMACHLLKEGWTTDEVKARLGQKPSSTVIDRYATYLAIGKHKPKRKIDEGRIKKLSNDLEEMKEREKLQGRRVEKQNEEMDEWKEKFELVYDALKKHNKFLRKEGFIKK